MYVNMLRSPTVIRPTASLNNCSNSKNKSAIGPYALAHGGGRKIVNMLNVFDGQPEQCVRITSNSIIVGGLLDESSTWTVTRVAEEVSETMVHPFAVR